MLCRWARLVLLGDGVHPRARKRLVPGRLLLGEAGESRTRRAAASRQHTVLGGASEPLLASAVVQTSIGTSWAMDEEKVDVLEITM